MSFCQSWDLGKVCLITDTQRFTILWLQWWFTYAVLEISELSSPFRWVGQSSLLCFLKYCYFITVVLIIQGGARKTECFEKHTALLLLNIYDIYFNRAEINILLLCYLQQNTFILILFKNYFTLMTVIVRNTQFLSFLKIRFHSSQNVFIY